MMDFFDQQQRTLIDYIDTPSQNTVGHFTNQIFNFAGGGLADNDTSLRSVSSDDYSLQRIMNSANSAFNGNGSVKYGSSPLGEGFYNSAPYIASHYTNLGKFFSGAPAGNEYTNHYTQPAKNPAIKSEDPNSFYARFYEGMRRFAEAKEVADAGQTITRSR